MTTDSGVQSYISISMPLKFVATEIRRRSHCIARAKAELPLSQVSELDHAQAALSLDSFKITTREALATSIYLRTMTLRVIMQESY